jgi:small GTP-binding protein
MGSRPTNSEATPSAKLVLLGQSTVGKTSIISVAEGGSFQPDQSATIGACFHIKKMKVDDTGIKFHIWDTAGQERFRALAPMYYRDAQFALLVYAIDSRDSFEEIEVWHQALANDCSPMPQVVLVGNKIDLVERRQITLEEGRALAKKLNARLFEISAKADAEGVRTMLQEIAIMAVTNLSRGGSQTDLGKNLAERGSGLNSCC